MLKLALLLWKTENSLRPILFARMVIEEGDQKDSTKQILEFLENQSGFVGEYAIISLQDIKSPFILESVVAEDYHIKDAEWRKV